MSVSKTTALVKAVLLWRSHQIFDFDVAIGPDERVSILSAPCSCSSVAIVIDWELEPGFSARLDAEVAREFGRAAANCVCHHKPFAPDFSAMACDCPTLVVPLKVECMDCDARGPSSHEEARRLGWTQVEPAEEFPGEGEWFTHLGFCPSCSAPGSATVDVDLKTDAA